MSKDTVTIRLSRNLEVEENIDIALIKLDKFPHKTGQPVVVRYYDRDRNVDAITAIGVKDGTGKDCYSIVSTSGELVVNEVLDTIPDVSALVNGEIYLGKQDERWCFISVSDTGEKTIDYDIKDNQIIRELQSGYRWFYFNNELKREDDFASSEEVDDILYRELSLIYHPELAISNVVVEEGTTVHDPEFNIKITDYSGRDLFYNAILTVKDKISGESVEYARISANRMYIKGDYTEDKEFLVSAKINLKGNTSTATSEHTVKLDFIKPIYAGNVDSLSDMYNETMKELWNGENKYKASALPNKYLKVWLPAEYSIVKILDGTDSPCSDSFDIVPVSVGENQYLEYRLKEKSLLGGNYYFVSSSYSTELSEYDRNLLISEIIDRVMEVVEQVVVSQEEYEELVASGSLNPKKTYLIKAEEE